MQDGVPILFFYTGGYLTAKLVHHHLHAIADSQDRKSAVIDPGGRKRRSRLINRGRATGEYDTLWVKGRYLLPRCVVGNDLAINPALSHPPGDKPAVLGAEVDYENRLSGRFQRRLGLGFLAALLPGDLEISRHLQIVAGGDSMGRWCSGVLCHLMRVSRLTPMIYLGQDQMERSSARTHTDNRLSVQVRAAVRVLKNDGIVAIPTDTFYGLAVTPFSSAAVERLFLVKGRSRSIAFPLLISDSEHIARYATDIPEAAWRLAACFWPGALTLVLRKAGCIPETVTGGRATVALRVPDHWVPRAIAGALDGPITGTSSNHSGKPPLTTAAEVDSALGGEVDLVIDAGPTSGTLPSTVLDLSLTRPRLLREGALSTTQIEETCGLAPGGLVSDV